MRPVTMLTGTLTRALLAALLFAAARPAAAQVPPAQAAPAAAPAVPAPPSPVSGIRNKISAGDLLSAESILEVHHAKYGEDGPWLAGYSWLARGALLLGDTAKAERYSAGVRANCAGRIAKGADIAKDHDLQIAFGASVEVEAQLLERSKGASRAAEYVRGELASLKGPVPLVSRLTKRLNMLALAGEAAPELAADARVAARRPRAPVRLARGMRRLQGSGRRACPCEVPVRRPRPPGRGADEVLR